MPRRPLALVLGLSLVGLLAMGSVCWWMLDGAGPVAPPPWHDDDASAPRVADEAADPVWADDDAPHGPTDAGDDDAEPGDADDDPAVRTAGELEAAATGPTLHVVRGTPPMSVAGAEVLFVAVAEAQRRGYDDSRPWEAPEQFGQRLLTDRSGLVPLPAGRGTWLCVARSEGEFAFASVSPRQRTTVLVLDTDTAVRIAIAHADGRPAAVPVALLQQFGDREARPVWHGTTDARGQALVRHFQLVRENPERRPGDERFAALAVVPASTPAVAGFDGRSADDQTVRLTLPPLAAVAVQLVDHQGRALSTPAAIGINPASLEPTTADGVRLPRGILSARVEKPAGKQPAVLPFAEVGIATNVWARYPADRRAARSEPFVAIAGDEPTAVEVRPLPHQTVLAGTFVDAAGRPLANTQVEAALWRDGRALSVVQIWTIDDGTWDVVLPGQEAQARTSIELRVPQRRDGDGNGAPLGAQAPVPGLLPGMRYDLPPITIGELPPLAHGLVVDDLGQPIEGATVQVQQEQPQTDRQNRGNQDPFRNVPLLRTRTDADGRFFVGGMLPPGNLRIHADAGQHFPTHAPLATAGRELQLTLVRHGVLTGRALLPPWLADNALSLTLVPFEQARRPSDTRTIALSRRRGGRFRIDALRAGRYDAQVLLRNQQEPMLVVHDVFVAPGPVQDPRLALLDLREALFRFRLRAVDQNGAPLPLDGPILARLPKLDGSIAEQGFRWRRGRAELVTTLPQLDATFFGRGIATQRLLLGPGDHDVVLPTLQPVLVDVAGARALCGPTRRVRISVILETDTGLPQQLQGVDQRSGEAFSFARWDLGKSSGGWLGATDLVEVPIMLGGRYEVILRAHATDSERSPQVSVPLGSYELHPDGRAFTPVPIRIDANALLEALRRVDEQQQEQERRRQQQPQRR
jgi:hypothetical protein